jgi:hypothetical protein
MDRDWKRARQWAFLGALVLAASAEVAADVMEHARRRREAGVATHATRDRASAISVWCWE